MSVLGGFDVGINVLHHQKLQVLHRLTNTRLIGHRGHGIGRHQPQALDLAGLDGRENIGLGQAAFGREEGLVDAPEIGDGLAIFFFLQRAIAGQAGAG